MPLSVVGRTDHGSARHLLRDRRRESRDWVSRSARDPSTGASRTMLRHRPPVDTTRAVYGLGRPCRTAKTQRMCSAAKRFASRGFWSARGAGIVAAVRRSRYTSLVTPRMTIECQQRGAASRSAERLGSTPQRSSARSRARRSRTAAAARCALCSRSTAAARSRERPISACRSGRARRTSGRRSTRRIVQEGADATSERAGIGRSHHVEPDCVEAIRNHHRLGRPAATQRRLDNAGTSGDGLRRLGGGSLAGNWGAAGKKAWARARSSAVERPAHNWLRAGSNPAGPNVTRRYSLSVRTRPFQG